MNELHPPEELVRDLERLGAREPRPYGSLVGNIHRWDRLMDEIGDYPGSLAYEYLNDLGSRGMVSLWLGLAAEESMDELLEWVLPIVDEIDDRYRDKSRPDTEGLNWDAGRLDPHSWWLRRLPEDEGLLEHFRTVGPNMRTVVAEAKARAAED